MCILALVLSKRALSFWVSLLLSTSRKFTSDPEMPFQALYKWFIKTPLDLNRYYNFFDDYTGAYLALLTNKHQFA